MEFIYEVYPGLIKIVKRYLNGQTSFPSRFIDNNIDAKGQHFELLTFGSGRKICPGLNGGDFCGLAERMVVEDVDMEEAPGLTVSKKSELLFVHVKYIT
ncbi:hypothetical protein YC2023_016878 [Brassica napus]